MKTPISRIGFAKVVRIPQQYLEQGGFGEMVELELRPEGLLLRPVTASSSESEFPQASYRPPACQDEAIWSWLD